MKMQKITIGMVLSTLLILTMISSSFSQGRGNHKHRQKNKYQKEVRYREYYYEGDRYVNVSNHYYVHRHPRPWIKRYHPQMKTRYIYFRDYNVYYDYHRRVYMTWSGRNWMFNAELPLQMRRIEPRRLMYADVDYYGDDLYSYHAHRRPYAGNQGMYCSR